MDSPFLGLRTCVFRVSDLGAARDWYAKILGQAAYFDEPFYVGFNVGGYELGLTDDPVTGKNRDNVHIYWGVTDVAESFERLLTLGARAHETPNDVGSGIVVASVKDPWDNIFGIICNPHFKLS